MVPSAKFCQHQLSFIFDVLIISNISNINYFYYGVVTNRRSIEDVLKADGVKAGEATVIPFKILVL